MRKIKVLFVSSKIVRNIKFNNHWIKKDNEEQLIKFADAIEAKNYFQRCLAQCNSIFFIDDCDFDSDTISRIMRLEKFNSRFIFASKNKNIFRANCSNFYECEPFSQKEIEQFLEAQNKTLSTLDFTNLCNYSKGNPLFLYYYLTVTIIPMPKNLIEYQRFIWDRLSESQKEILIFSAISYSVTSFENLRTFFEKISPLKMDEEIKMISHLLKMSDKTIEIFHSSFKDFIIEYLKEHSLLDFYKLKIGDFYLESEQFLDASYILLDITPEKVEPFLYDIFPFLESSGDLNFALKVLNVNLLNAKTDNDKAYANYHLYNIHSLLGNRTEASNCIDQAFLLCKNDIMKELKSGILIFKAIDLVSNGEINEAKNIADLAFKTAEKCPTIIKASLLISLSKIYIELSEFKKAANASKEAFEISKTSNLTRGFIYSAVNLVGSLAQINEYIDKAEEYGLKLLQLLQSSKNTQNCLIQLAIINALTTIYRKQEKFEKAKEFGFKAVELSQKYELKDKVVMNLINYGNVIRDNGDTEQSIKIYKEALEKARQINSDKEEARVYWLLAEVNRDLKNFTLSLEYIEKAITLNENSNYKYGLARSLEVKASILIEKNDDLEAANFLYESAKTYGDIDFYKEDANQNYLKTSEILAREGQKDKALRVVEELLDSDIFSVNYYNLGNFLLNELSAINTTHCFEKIFSNYFNNRNETPIGLNLLHSFIAFCKKNKDSMGKKLYLDVINISIGNLNNSNFCYSTLSLLVEKSQDLIDERDLSTIIEKFKSKLPFIHIRDICDKKVILSSIGNNINLEIHVLNDDMLTQKLALSLILVLNECKEFFLETNELKEQKCVIVLLPNSEELDEIKQSISDSLTDIEQTVHLEIKDNEYSKFIIVGDLYEYYSSLEKFTENKVFIFFLVNTIMGIKEHFYHLMEEEKENQSKVLFKDIAYLYGLVPINDVNQHFNFDLDEMLIN
ncbi:tetratricopeptide repeat protein [Lentisphaerota bacterium WC36G]|nr:tetratricopeptide repeat protein [Lentisphaerae bacterium WC36]